jgi:aminomethyltransferase
MLNAPIAMGYVRYDVSPPGTPVLLLVRGKQLPAQVCKLPFIPHRYAS